MQSTAYNSFWSTSKSNFKRLPVAIRTIILINVVVFLVQKLGGNAVNAWLVTYLGFNPELPVFLTQPWRLVTYSFLHANFLHILFNMLWLWWMGKTVEQTVGPRTFTVIYLGAAVLGALLDGFIAQAFGKALVIGASGAVTGILVAFAVLYPRAPIMLFLLPPIPAKYFVIGWVALDVLFVGNADGIARLVHLGGALGGYLLIKAHQRGTDLSLIIRYFEYLLTPKNKNKTRTAEKRGRKSGARSKNKKMHIVRDAKVVEEKEISQSELDTILDKISKHGYSALTDEEKRKLFEISKKE